MATIIDGNAIAAAVRAEVKERVAALRASRGIVPGLATVLVGDDPGSAVYVRNKRKACEEVGMTSFGYELPATASEAEVVALVQSLAGRADVHGILTQLPMPKGIREEIVLGMIPLAKDVDGFHPSNIGLLGQKNRRAAFAPCTPQGCIELLTRTGVTIAGKRAVVVGRSAIVGLPVGLMLLARDATVTYCHSRTVDLPAVTREADILIAAIGKPRFVTADMVKPGAVVIDVGINRIADPTRKSGTRLVGDVDYEAVEKIAGAITPVPGGVGPMTIAMLLQNTLKAAEAR